MSNTRHPVVLALRLHKEAVVPVHIYLMARFRTLDFSLHDQRPLPCLPSLQL